MPLFYEFIDEIRRQKFETYKQAIDFLEPFQQPDVIHDVDSSLKNFLI